MTREGQLAQTLVQLADSLVDNFDVVDLLTLLADRCVAVLDVSAAGITLVGPEGTLHLMASSSETMRLLELFELQAQEGPCMDCYRTGVAVINAHLDGAGDRWPRFAPAALDAGFHSVHALPMRLRGTIIGALNMFRIDQGGLGPGDIGAAQAFADVATIAILQHRAATEAQVVNEQLTQALTSRVMIEQAKGVVAERANVDLETAFSRLRSFARSHNRRLVDVAGDVLSGALGTDALGVAPRQQN
jgi:GAF domain-containing protein